MAVELNFLGNELKVRGFRIHKKYDGGTQGTTFIRPFRWVRAEIKGDVVEGGTTRSENPVGTIQVRLISGKRRSLVLGSFDKFEKALKKLLPLPEKEVIKDGLRFAAERIHGPVVQKTVKRVS